MHRHKVDLKLMQTRSNIRAVVIYLEQPKKAWEVQHNAFKLVELSVILQEKDVTHQVHTRMIAKAHNA